MVSFYPSDFTGSTCSILQGRSETKCNRADTRTHTALGVGGPPSNDTLHKSLPVGHTSQQKAKHPTNMRNAVWGTVFGLAARRQLLQWPAHDSSLLVPFSSVRCMLCAWGASGARSASRAPSRCFLAFLAALAAKSSSHSSSLRPVAKLSSLQSDEFNHLLSLLVYTLIIRLQRNERHLTVA
eukprot:6175116-Pleurochrysis_carterae.AAC.2